MIQGNELRIGNRTEQGPIESLTCMGAEFMFGVSKGFLHYSQIDPIPITEEWLEKLGFEKGFRRYSYHTHVHIEKYTTTSQGWINNAWSVLMISSVPYHLGRQFKYVHEIQNLWMAMTGKELEVKL